MKRRAKGERVVLTMSASQSVADEKALAVPRSPYYGHVEGYGRDALGVYVAVAIEDEKVTTKVHPSVLRTAVQQA